MWQSGEMEIKIFHQVDGDCGGEWQGVERGRREGWKERKTYLQSEITIHPGVWKYELCFHIISPLTTSKSQSKLFSYKPQHVSRRLLSLCSLPFWPSFNASLVFVHFYGQRLILGAFVVFHYKKKQKTAADFSFACLSPSLIFRSARVLANGNAVEPKSHVTLHLMPNIMHRCYCKMCCSCSVWCNPEWSPRFIQALTLLNGFIKPI